MEPPARRFPAPWSITREAGGWSVKDNTGLVLAYVYAREQPAGVADRSLSVDEARRIATGIARLPELLGWDGRKA